MGNPKGDWAPTRDPKRNAEITRQWQKQAANEAAYLKHLQAFRERRAHNLPGIEKYINQQIPILLGAWQEQVDNAITDAEYPVEPESKIFFWIALGGNLLWAATCLVNPAAGLAIGVMSFAGAFIGSGGIQKVAGEPDSPPPPPNSPEGAKTGLRQRVAKARGKLEKYFLEKGHEWGSGFESLQDWEQSDAIILNQFNAYIWKQMFPSIPYDDDRFDQIRLMAVDAVTSAVSDFNGQWAKFKRNAVWFGAKERKKQNIVFRPVLKVSFAGKPLWNAAEVHGQSGPQYH